MVKDTTLYEILGQKKFAVNSLHIMFAKDENIRNLTISAYSEDGFVEAVELTEDSLFILGIKWHPEVMMNYDTDMNKIFLAFIKACQKRMKSESIGETK